jgi:DnaJ-class molecular chaperone
MKDYYQILNIPFNSSKKNIKKKYYELSLKYHPDKNNFNDEKFKEINEAYEILYHDDSRNVYNIQYLFSSIEFSDQELKILESYYLKIIQSNEFKLCKLLYHSLPKNIFKKLFKNKQLIKSQKRIDIQSLNNDQIIYFIISNHDFINQTLKIIYIFTKNGIYYLYIRDFSKNIIINNQNCNLFIQFNIKKNTL